MSLRIILIFLLLAIPAFAKDASSAQNSVLDEQRVSSPNKKYVVDCKLLTPPKWGIWLYQDSEEIHHQIIQNKYGGLRYVRFSWSPDSRFLLIGKNYKAYMTIEVVRVYDTHLETTLLKDDPLGRAILSKIPFQKKTENSAEFAHYAWHSLKWIAPDQCTITYVDHGYGYDATLKVLIHCQPASLKILSIHPGFSAKDMSDL